MEKTSAWKIQQFQVITGLYHLIINEQKCAWIFSLLKKHHQKKNPVTSSFSRVAFCFCGLGYIFTAVIYLGLCHSELRSRWVFLLGVRIEDTGSCSSVWCCWAFCFFSENLIRLPLPFCPPRFVTLVLSTWCLHLWSHQLQNML